jgi:hypothetical protein
MTAGRCGLSLVLALAALTAVRAQKEPDLDLVIDKLGTYLADYEKALGQIVADEKYFQQEIGLDRGGARQVTGRTLESEVAFLRLPGGADWYGIRDVRRVDGNAVAGAGVRLSDLLKDPGADFIRRATAIVEESTRHNLGGARTINMATVPLEALSARNHPRYIFKERGGEKVRGAPTTRIDFEEFDEPTLIQAADGGNVWIRGRAWVEAQSGRVWRVEMTVSPDRPNENRRPDLESRMRVDFAFDATLKMLIPTELVEAFWIPRGRGEGRARYSNFRRFTTSGRIVPGA